MGLDVVKGVLVLLMILYHWLNYFVGPRGDFYKYLRFITPSFIFLAGFLVAHLYLRKYNAVDPRLRWRLFQRGLRLLALFLGLNVAGILALNHFGPDAGREVAAFFANTHQVFVAGNGNPGAFAILVPISYLLMFLAAHLWLSGGRPRFDWALGTGLFVLIYFLRQAGVLEGYLELFTFGILGMVCGRATPEMLQRLGARRFEVFCLWICYLVWLSEWNEILPMQVLGVLATLGLLFAWGAHCAGTSWWMRRLMILGAYSLPAYIVQIGVLIILERLLPRSLGGARLVVSFPATVALTVLAIETTVWLRQRMRAADSAYRFVFG